MYIGAVGEDVGVVVTGRDGVPNVMLHVVRAYV